ncbi:MAG: SAM-dependent chlorinase/fluorinase [Desulfatiglans sp.]|nr:SAM-dependent chlorinase/fluorinase [Thermodesulfobacteriota bacterium]MEE4354502.1 SAM-dependent chlorinase/fluorinase [Desulfatiglans sp.]
MKTFGIITLTTDFGLTDPYLGAMKGAILTINQRARLVDISHQVKQGHVFRGASVLREAYPYFPKGSIHVAVVDPGVGGNRRPIALKADDHFFVGPDNGIFWPVIEKHGDVRIVHLTEAEFFLPDLSRTFHGRDIFAPVAAHLSRGADLLRMGPLIDDPVQLELPTVKRKGDILTGQIIRVDHFGNLITNIYEKDLKGFLRGAHPSVGVRNERIDGLCQKYSDVDEGEMLVLIGSSGYLEIGVNLGRACDRLSLDPESLVGVEVEVGPGGRVSV